MNYVLDDILMHYGMPRRSGRYPYGSGDNPYQHSGDFMATVEKYRAEGITYTDEDGKVWRGDTAIAKTMGMTTTQFRAQYTIAKNERRALEVSRAKALREDGYSLQQIASEMGYPSESSIRSLLNADRETRMKQAQITADLLRSQVDEKGMIDISAGVERELGVSREKLNEALKMLEDDGYHVYGGGIPQVTNPGKQSNMKVLTTPDKEHKDIYKFEDVKTIRDYQILSTPDGDVVVPKKTFEYPESLDSRRLQIRYAEEGGINKDGVIELRRGVEDISLGGSNYAQVRIMVDGTHYLKGMAVYADDLPEGIDIRFNTNKKLGTPQGDVLKKIKSDPDNPFGSLIKEEGGQRHYIGEDGKDHLSLINKRAEEGDWGEWSDHLPSQFLSKQTLGLAKQQLKLAEVDKRSEFEELISLTNPTVKREMLRTFAEECESAAVHLQAAALPRQKYQVILPLNTIGEKQIYAPNYQNGEQVALIRYPHGGTFEIPILTVNNKNREGIDILSRNPKDAVGISAKVAERLSGADFDGDTVMVIPINSKIRITSTPALKELEGFDPKLRYGTEKKVDANGVEHYYRGDKEIKLMKNTQNEMGRISNLITDMTLQGASNEELARAVMHSMVVIDAEKHHLDYKASERDNAIDILRKNYQGHLDENGKYKEGAATLISRAKSQYDVPKRKGSPKVDKNTGEVTFKEANEYYIDKNGKEKLRMQKSTKMAETKDARTLISDARTPMEGLYADYANAMKSLANQARKEAEVTPALHYSPSAREAFKEEYNSLRAKLDLAMLNAPREREAQRIANVVVTAKKQDNPDMTKKELKKEKQRALTEARLKVGASGKETRIDITDKEWEAIQAGAVTDNILSQILQHTDKEALKQRATPRASNELSSSKQAKIAAMRNSGYTNSEIANALGVSTSTVSRYLN